MSATASFSTDPAAPFEAVRQVDADAPGPVVPATDVAVDRGRHPAQGWLCFLQELLLADTA